MHWLLLLFSQLVFAFFTSVLLCTFMVTWQFMLQQFQSPWPKLLGKFSGTPWRQCALSSCRRKLLVKCVNLFVGRRAQCARLFKWLCWHLIPEHWCLVLNLKMCLFRHRVTTFTLSDAVLKHKQARSRGRGRGGSSPPRNFQTWIKFCYKSGIFLLKWTAVNGN